MLLRFLDSNTWQNDFASRRVQQFGFHLNFFDENDLTPLGDIPKEFSKVMAKLEKEGILPVAQCQQIIINEYVGPKQGIGKHVDCDVFGDTIVSLTLGDPCALLMHETLPQAEYNFKTLEQSGRVFSMILESQSIVVLQKDARYLWKHEIPKSNRVDVNGTVIERGEDYRRVSVTFRSVVMDDPRVKK